MRFLDAPALEDADLETLRFAVFAAVALFALGLADFASVDRPLIEDLGDDLRVGVRDVDRLIPLVTGLLIRGSR